MLQVLIVDDEFILAFALQQQLERDRIMARSVLAGSGAERGPYPMSETTT